MDMSICVKFGGPTVDIPREVFLRICELAISGQNPVSPLLLGKICRTWRHLCYSTPSLWTRPKITFKADASQLTLLTEWIDRAADLPLSLHICDPTDFLNGNRDPPQCVPLLEYLTEKAPQVRSFITEAPSMSIFNPPFSHHKRFTSDRFQWSILSRLHISYVGDTTIPIFDNCPKLIDLGFDYFGGWHNTKGIRTLSWIPWKNLRHANFRGLGYDDLMRVFRKARDLESLNSTWVSDYTVDCSPAASKDYWRGPGLTETKAPRKLMIHHQKLKNWSFSQKEKKYLAGAFNNMQLLRLPALKTLKIEWECTGGKYGTFERPARATKGWECALRQFDVSLAGFKQEHLVEWMKAPEMATLRSLKLHWEHHSDIVTSPDLSSVLFVAMTVTPGKDPILPKLRSLVVDDTSLDFSPDVIIEMLASRWDNGANFPLKSCIINARMLDNPAWHVTEEHQAALRLWRERGYTVELGVSEGPGEEVEEEEEEEEAVADYQGKEYIFRAL